MALWILLSDISMFMLLKFCSLCFHIIFTLWLLVDFVDGFCFFFLLRFFFGFPCGIKDQSFEGTFLKFSFYCFWLASSPYERWDFTTSIWFDLIWFYCFCILPSGVLFRFVLRFLFCFYLHLGVGVEICFSRWFYNLFVFCRLVGAEKSFFKFW